MNLSTLLWIGGIIAAILLIPAILGLLEFYKQAPAIKLVSKVSAKNPVFSIKYNKTTHLQQKAFLKKVMENLDADEIKIVNILDEILS